MEAGSREETDEEVEEDLIVMGAQLYEHPAMAEGPRQSPHPTLPRLAMSVSVGKDSSKDEDTKPTAAEKKRSQEGPCQGRYQEKVGARRQREGF